MSLVPQECMQKHDSLFNSVSSGVTQTRKTFSVIQNIQQHSINDHQMIKKYASIYLKQVNRMQTKPGLDGASCQTVGARLVCHAPNLQVIATYLRQVS